MFNRGFEHYNMRYGRFEHNNLRYGGGLLQIKNVG